MDRPCFSTQKCPSSKNIVSYYVVIQYLCVSYLFVTKCNDGFVKQNYFLFRQVILDQTLVEDVLVSLKIICFGQRI
jgi:hypothetical protein